MAMLARCPGDETVRQYIITSHNWMLHSCIVRDYFLVFDQHLVLQYMWTWQFIHCVIIEISLKMDGWKGGREEEEGRKKKEGRRRKEEGGRKKEEGRSKVGRTVGLLQASINKKGA